MLNPKDFVNKIIDTLGIDIPADVCYEEYKKYFISQCDFSNYNFEYLIEKKDTKIVNVDNFDELSAEMHYKYLHLLSSVYIQDSEDDSFSLNMLLKCFGLTDANNGDVHKISHIMPISTYELSFPFDNMRPVQKGIFEKIEEYLKNSNITDIIIDAPTGCGKSGIAIASLLKSPNGYLVTANKALQNQYASEFPWLSDLRGKSNYMCRFYADHTCKSSPCQKTADSRKQCKNECGGCDYGTAKRRALSINHYSLMNMHTAISYSVYVPSAMESRSVLVIDEAHALPEVIASSVGLSLSLKSLTPYGINEIPYYTSPKSYASWLTSVHEVINEDEDIDEDGEQLAHKIIHIVSKLSSDNIALDYERDINDKDIITVLKMHPIRVEEYYDKIKAKGDLRIHLSATILGYETYCNMLGIKKENVAIIRVGSPFPKEIRPIITSHTVGSLNMSTINSLMPKIVNNIEHLLNHYHDQRGIIHGVTYSICNNIYDKLSYKNKSRILFPRSAKEQAECLKKHKESKNTILLSPSMTEGIDLKGDLSRIQIMVKTPYPYLGDPILLKRKEIYYGYYESLTATTIMQAYGRSVRDVNDYCHTYLLDQNFINFIRSNKGIFPSWFLEAIC